MELLSKNVLFFVCLAGHSRLASAKVRTISDTAKQFCKYFFTQNLNVLQFLSALPLFTGSYCWLEFSFLFALDCKIAQFILHWQGIFPSFFAFSAVEHFFGWLFWRILEDFRGFQRISEDIRGFYRTFEDFGGLYLDFAEGIFGFCWGIGDFFGEHWRSSSSFSCLGMLNLLLEK